MNYLSATYQVEGFMVMSSRNPNGLVHLAGGSFLGDDFIEIMKTKDNPWRKFRAWVTGLHIDAELKGWDLESVSKKRLESLSKKRKRVSDTTTTKETKKKDAVPQPPQCQEVIKHPWDLGSVRANRKSMTVQLKQLLCRLLIIYIHKAKQKLVLNHCHDLSQTKVQVFLRVESGPKGLPISFNSGD